MRKSFIISLFMLISVFSQQFVYAQEDIMTLTRLSGYDISDQFRPKASIVIDGQSGSVLWEEQVDDVRDPASMTKVMTLFLLFESIEKGELTEDTLIKATETDVSISQLKNISNNNIVAGVSYPVEDLIYMALFPSSNVATVMLANYLSHGDAGAFVQRMNDTAKVLGMTRTTFYNATGAVSSAFNGYYQPDGFDLNKTNETTARDLAILTYHIINRYPKILDYTKHLAVITLPDTPYREKQSNSNYSVQGNVYGMEGVIGLKTGSSPSADFNYISVAKREDTVLIGVIMGVGDWSDFSGNDYKHVIGNALMNNLFSKYEYKKVFDKGEYSLSDNQTAIVPTDVYATVSKNTMPEIEVKDNHILVNNQLPLVSDVVEKKIRVDIIQTTISVPKSHLDGRLMMVIVCIGLTGIYITWICLKRKNDQTNK